MNTSSWDEDAEEYLRHVVDIKKVGGVPAAYPSTFYEYTWVSPLTRSPRGKLIPYVSIRFSRRFSEQASQLQTYLARS